MVATIERIGFSLGACSLGRALVATTARGVCAVLLGDDDEALRADIAQRFPDAALAPAADDPRIAAALAAVDGRGAFDAVPLDVRGTTFQRRVWRELRRVPAGATVDYSQLAARIGSPTGARAVASACAGNPLAVVVPCHRVVRKDGGLSGYRWGVARKRALLDREAVVVS